MPDDQLPDAQQRAREIDAEARDRAQRGNVDARVWRAVARPFTSRHWEQEAESLAHIASARPIPNTGTLAPLVRFLKRAVRRSVAWYVRPIADDQSRFNEAILNRVHRLEQAVGRMQLPWADAAYTNQPEPVLTTARLKLISTWCLRSSGIVVVCNAPELQSALSGVTSRSAFHDEYPLDALAQWENAVLGGVYVAGALHLLGPGELAALVHLARAKLEPGGWLICDAPDISDLSAEAAVTPAAFPIRVPLRREHVERLFVSGGFDNIETTTLLESGATHSWFATAGTVAP